MLCSTHPEDYKERNGLTAAPCLYTQQVSRVDLSPNGAELAGLLQDKLGLVRITVRLGLSLVVLSPLGAELAGLLQLHGAPLGPPLLQSLQYLVHSGLGHTLLLALAHGPLEAL